MKFWISLVAGVVLLTIVGTVMIVLNPGMKAPKAAEPELEETTGPQPRLVVAGESTLEFDNVAQGITDEATFVVENKGEGELRLTPYYPKCTCAGLEVKQKTPAEPTEDFIRMKAKDKKWSTTASKNSPGFVTIPPGGSAEVTVQWDTTNRLGKYSVAGELKTNDRSHKLLTFTINLNVKRDIMYHEAPEVEFGTLSQGEKSERTILIYSPIHEDMKIVETSTSTAALQAELRPIPDDLRESLAAKSGNLVAIISDGTLPEGHFRHELTFATSLNPNNRETVPIRGTVRGKMELLPSVVNFGVAAAGKQHEVVVKVFAHGLDKERKLKIAELTPSFLKAEIKNDETFPTLWELRVQLEASAPAGTFEGNLSIADDQDVKRVNIPTKGVVAGSGTDSSVTQR